MVNEQNIKDTVSEKGENTLIAKKTLNKTEM